MARDIIDALIDQLNDGVPGIIFDRDVIETNRPDDWGAVELVGPEAADFADGEMTDQTLSCDIWVCQSDRGSAVKRRVQKVLRNFSGDNLVGWRFVQRSYLYDLDKVMWRWNVTVWGPLAEDEDDGESGGAGTGDAGTGDAGTGDAGTGDAGTGDAGTGDAGNGDAGNGEAGTDSQDADPQSAGRDPEGG